MTTALGRRNQVHVRWSPNQSAPAPAPLETEVLLRRSIIVAVAVFVAMLQARVSSVVEELHGMPSFSVPIALGLIIVTLATYLADVDDAKVAGPATTLVGLTFLLLIAVRLPGLVLSIDRDIVLENVALYAKDVVVVLGTVYAIERVGGLRAAVIALIAASAVIAAMTVHKVATGTSFDYLGFSRASTGLITEDEGLRQTGPFLDPNYYAQALVVGFGLAVGLAIGDDRRFDRRLGLAAAAVVVTAIGLTFSRGGMLAVAVILAVLAWRRFRFRAALVAAVALVGFLSLAPGATAERFRSMGEAPLAILRGGNAIDPSLSGRASEAFVAVQMFADHPVFGIGAGTFDSNYLEYANGNGIEIRRIDRAAHSLPLEVGAELGLLGLLGFGIIAGSALFVPLVVRNRLRAVGQTESAALADGVHLAVLGYFITAFFLHDAVSRLFVLVVGLGLVTTMLLPAAGAGTPQQEAAHG